MRDTEQIPLLEDGRIEAFFRREVQPYVPDAWIDESATKIGYEISFTRYFYKPTPLRSLESLVHLPNHLWIPADCPLCTAGVPLEDIAGFRNTLMEHSCADQE